MLMGWLFMKAGARRLTSHPDQFEITFLPVSFCGAIVCPACSYKKFTQSHRAFGGFWVESAYAQGQQKIDGLATAAITLKYL
ncbi:MAG: hypothetical protein COB74_00855 [Shewanella sp.]|nr:MAG: hypothetical protein COB74_00855 [Shewanella sp.]